MPTTTLPLKAAADAMTSAGFPTKNYAGIAYLQLNAAPNERNGYVFFNQPMPVGVTVLGATLIGRQRGAATGGNRTLTVRRAAAEWAESTIAYQGRPPATGATATRTLGNSTQDGREWIFDVKAHMQEVADGADWWGFRIDSNNATAINFYSRETAGEFVWTLEVEWSDAPAAPSRLSPAGSRAISVARPTLRFDFTDVSGDTTMGGYVVEVSTSPAFTSIAFTSGEVDNDLPQWTLTGDLTLGTTYYWRVKVWDEAGVESPWSETATFKRIAKPALDITSPAPAPSNIVYTTSPTIAWTVAGQTAFQLFLARADEPTAIVWTSDKIPGAVASYVLPATGGALLTPGEDYLLTVRIWDGAIARESIPEEDAHTDAQRPFSFGTSTSTPGVTALAATADDDLPFVTATWSRNTLADSYLILADGKVHAIIDAADASLGGTSYAYEVRGLRPNREVELGVAAIDGTSTSDPATTTVTPSGEGWWLYSLDPGGPVVSFIIRDDSTQRPIKETVSEDTAIFRPAGGRAVMISQTVRKPDGESSDAWIDAVDLESWEAITSPRVVTVGMTISDQAKRIQVYNVLTGYADEEFLDRIPVDFQYIESGD